MKKTLTGTVTSDKCSKTRRVEVRRDFRHRKYGKIVQGRTVCHAHDEQNQSHEGDVVEIVESRPRSALKRWEVVRVITQANPELVASMKGETENEAERAI